MAMRCDGKYTLILILGSFCCEPRGEFEVLVTEGGGREVLSSTEYHGIVVRTAVFFCKNGVDVCVQV